MKKLHPKIIFNNLHVDGDLGRWDLVTAYIFVKDYIELGIENKIYDYGTYKKWMGINQVRPIAGYSNCNMDNQKGMFLSAINGIQKKYDKSNPIELGRNNLIIDGLHRLSIMLYLKKEIPYVIKDLDGCVGFNLKWYKDNMPEEHIERIEQEYKNILEI